MAILKTVRPEVVDYGPDYWAMHFAAVFECLDDHPSLEKGPHQFFDPSFGEWSLSDYRGESPPSAFSRMRNTIQNWGAQYLLADLLNENLHGYRTAIIDALSDVHNDSLLNAPADEIACECYVSGRDSRSGKEFLQSCRARILGDKRRRVHTSRSEVEFADLCLILNRYGQGPLAVFGEAEGNHGRRLLRDRFWSGKADLAQFGIGLIPGQGERAKIQIHEALSGNKIILTMGTEKNVIKDFHDVVGLVDRLVHTGPNERRWWKRIQPLALQDMMDLVVAMWRKPIQDVIAVLRDDVIISSADIQSFDSTGTPSEIVVPDFVEA